MDQQFIDVIKNLSSVQLGQLRDLLTEKDELKARLEQVDHDLQIVAKGGALARRRRGPSAAGTKSGGRSPRIRESVLNLLKEAGAAGLTVKAISDKIGKKTTHLHSWFHSTGTKIEGLKKIGTAHYVYSPKA
jgi:hypothetical protein